MNKKYIDFVPAKAKKAPVKKPKAAQPKVAKPKAVVKPKASQPKAPRAKVVKPADPLVALGVVEDLNPQFTHTDVPKKPLGAPKHFATAASPVRKAKAAPVGNQTPTKKPVEKPVEKSTKKSDKSTYKPPKSPFINQDKIKKRPLSKNVYHKTPTPAKETPKAPVTIITKPEKDSRVGLVITIVLTIILGAAAGTVAFLLLPK